MPVVSMAAKNTIAGIAHSLLIPFTYSWASCAPRFFRTRGSVGARQPAATKSLQDKSGKNIPCPLHEAPGVRNIPLVHQRQESEGIEESSQKQVLLCVHQPRRRRGTESRPAMVVFTFLRGRWEWEWEWEEGSLESVACVDTIVRSMWVGTVSGGHRNNQPLAAVLRVW